MTKLLTSLIRLFWNEKRKTFVEFHDKEKVVDPKPMGFPTGFRVAETAARDEENIASEAPKGANAYCSGNIHNNYPRKSSFEVQYYRI